MTKLLSEGATIFMAEENGKWFGPPTKVVDNATGYEFDPDCVRSAEFVSMSDMRATDPDATERFIRISIDLELEVEHVKNAIEVETEAEGVIRYDENGIHRV